MVFGLKNDSKLDTSKTLNLLKACLLEFSSFLNFTEYLQPNNELLINERIDLKPFFLVNFAGLF